MTLRIPYCEIDNNHHKLTLIDLFSDNSLYMKVVGKLRHWWREGHTSAEIGV